jgi:hypothetical protein
VLFVRGLAVFVLIAVSASQAEEGAKLYSKVPAVSQGTPVLWHDPGAVESLDMAHGIGGRALMPSPPYRFVWEDLGGTNPKVRVRDANDREWAVKFGEEASPDTFASRIAWAAGYYVEPTYYVEFGRIDGAHDLQRAKGDIGPGGVFHGGRFQLRANSPQFLPGVGWSWDKNPFAGTRELNGLKVIMMLTSNWDNKDIRDSTRGSNTAIFRADEWGGRYVYLIDDWGSAMGAWGHVWSRSKWNCADYSRQTPEFVKGVKHGYVQWGYHGQHTKDETRDIRVDDIRWLLRYLGRITDGQIRDALRASGATPEQVDCFASAVRERIDQLKSASDGWGEATANTSRP